ncbi:MAG: hypothetical protein APF83_00515 [Lutibacter sp. BRH_c52]|nr:MAG: hypothetical protein APF83_00515 [Lutibacter sp. BRH_c52]HCE55767.1 hypothetical protein [Lutibacter sp.]
MNYWYVEIYKLNGNSILSKFIWRVLGKKFLRDIIKLPPPFSMMIHSVMKLILRQLLFPFQIQIL